MVQTGNDVTDSDSPPQVLGSAFANYPIGQYRGARLLADTGVRSRVNDAIFFMSNNAADKVNLGLCQDGNYNGGFYNVQQRNGPFKSGNGLHFIVTCGNTDSYASGTQLVTLTEWGKRSTGGANANNPQVTGTLPANADDCARLCVWIQAEFVSTGDANYNTNCQSWEWQGSTFDQGVCNLFSGVNAGAGGVTKLNPGKTGIFAAGGRVGNQANYVTSWKRSINPGEPAGRYKRNLMVEERSEDWMRPDVVLRAADYPI
jgi:hypothetical protein